jgi:hypothetical protein
MDVGDKGGSVRETKNSAEANSKQERRQPGISEKMTREGLYDAATVCPATKCRRSRDPLVPRRDDAEFWGNIRLEKEARQEDPRTPRADQIRFEIKAEGLLVCRVKVNSVVAPRCRVITLQRTQMRVSLKARLRPQVDQAFFSCPGPEPRRKQGVYLTDVRNNVLHVGR